MSERGKSTDAANAALADALSVSFRVLRYLMVVLLGLYLLSGIFVVDKQEKALVLVFGRVTGMGSDRVKGPGLHWTLPRPLAAVTNVPTERVQSVESATFWQPAPPTRPGELPQLMPMTAPGGYTLTGDANLLHSRWTLRYTIEDPEAYVFRFQNTGALIANELDRAIVKVSARFPIDQALRTELESFRGAVAAEVRGRCEELGLGIKVEGVEVLGVAPPRPVADAFNAVVAAENERSERISGARGYAARALNEAQGQAAKLRAEGESYRLRLVSEVSADADYFNKVYEQYRKNPEVIARTLWQDTVRRVLVRVDHKYVVQRPQEGGQEVRILVSPPAKSAFGAGETEKKP